MLRRPAMPSSSSSSSARLRAWAAERAGQLRGQRDVVEGREVVEQVEELEDHPDPAAAEQRQPGLVHRPQVLAVHDDRAGRSAGPVRRSCSAAWTCRCPTAPSRPPPRRPGSVSETPSRAIESAYSFRTAVSSTTGAVLSRVSPVLSLTVVDPAAPAARRASARGGNRAAGSSRGCTAVALADDAARAACWESWALCGNWLLSRGGRVPGGRGVRGAAAPGPARVRPGAGGARLAAGARAGERGAERGRRRAGADRPGAARHRQPQRQRHGGPGGGGAPGARHRTRSRPRTPCWRWRRPAGTR